METPLLAPQELNDQNSQKGARGGGGGGDGMNSSSGPPNFLLPFPGNAIEEIEWSKSAFTFQQGQGLPQDYYGDGYHAPAP